QYKNIVVAATVLKFALCDVFKLQKVKSCSEYLTKENRRIVLNGAAYSMDGFYFREDLDTPKMSGFGNYIEFSKVLDDINKEPGNQ
ncbi:MAG: hypothetical protein AAFY64_06465, partial [Pseudomonadota bacterium]